MHVHGCTKTHVDLAVASAKQALDSYNNNNNTSTGTSTSTASKVRDMLWHTSDILLKYKNEFTYLETLNGKPESEAIIDVESASNVFRYYAGYADKLSGRTYSFSTNASTNTNTNTNTSARHYTIRHPIGVCALITSYNYPLLLLAWKLAPALACQNTILIKPAPETPHSALFLTELMYSEMNIPNGVINVLPGTTDVGKALVQHPIVDKISFTGSSATGEWITRHKGMKNVTLELGSKNAIIVSKSVVHTGMCDEDKMISCIVDAVFGMFFALYIAYF
jgi:acyl-CoA reductase-like NAD-dependent aldehyde dehydrogenase